MSPHIWASGGTVRQEYRTLDHPEHDLNRLKAPWAPRNLPLADNRARALPMRRPRSSSHHASDPTGARKSLKLEVPFDEHPWKSAGQKDWASGHAGMTSVLSKLTVNPMRREAFSQSGEEAADGWGRTSAEAVVEEKGADVDAPRMRGLRGGTGLSDGRVDSQSEENQTKRVTLLNASSAANGLQSNVSRTGGQGALVAVTAVDPCQFAGRH